MYNNYLTKNNLNLEFGLFRTLMDDLLFPEPLPAIVKKYDYEVLDNDNTYTINLKLAGFKKDEIDVSLNNSTIFINAVKKIDDGSENIRSFSSDRKRYTYQLPKSITLDEIDVTYDDGVLTIILNKQKDLVKKISVK